MAGNKRYWVYVNDDVEETMHDDLGDFTLLSDAFVEAGRYIRYELEKLDLTVRIVDNSTSTTVWIAGPGNQITKPEGWTVMDEPASKD